MFNFYIFANFPKFFIDFYFHNIVVRNDTWYDFSLLKFVNTSIMAIWSILEKNFCALKNACSVVVDRIFYIYICSLIRTPVYVISFSLAAFGILSCFDFWQFNCNISQLSCPDWRPLTFLYLDFYLRVQKFLAIIFLIIFFPHLLFFSLTPVTYTLSLLMPFHKSHKFSSFLFILFSSVYLQINCFLVHIFFLLFDQFCSWHFLLHFPFNLL